MKKTAEGYTSENESVTRTVTQKQKGYSSKKTNNSKSSIQKEVWLTVQETVTLLRIAKQNLHKNRRKGKYITKTTTARGGTQYLFLLSSLPESAQAKYWKEHLSENNLLQDETPPAEETDLNMLVYAQLKNWERKVADKYLNVFSFVGESRGKELEMKVEVWNEDHPDKTVKVSTVYQKKKAYEEFGLTALVPKYGKSSGSTKIEKTWFEYYESLYLKQGKPSVYSCWLQTLGFAKKLKPEITVQDFPCPGTFDRKLKRKYPKSAICMARFGEKKWNEKYGNYIDRDYGGIKPGECYVSDHAQIDVAAQLSSGKVCFPWVTAWVDFASQKVLSWSLHPESPNSDHIFQTYYEACKNYGIPTDLILDNGKDYRSKDFAGGREYYAKREVDEETIKPAIIEMGTTPHFAIPYNAQTKVIERVFLKIKEWFSKHTVGYRGGHIKERPEKLQEEIKSGSILPWDDYVKIFDDFITNILNKMPSQGKVLKGMSPDELWTKERITPRMASPEALLLLCMRSSKVVSIGKNGVRDSEVDCYYWSEWMSAYKGEKVYFKRDIKAYEEAWVFRASDDEFLGKASIAEKVPALARTSIEKKQLKEGMARKKRAKKLEKSYLETKYNALSEDKLDCMKAGVKALNESRGYEESEEKSKIITLMATSMDKVVRKTKEQEREGVDKLFIPINTARKKKEDNIKEFWYEVLSEDEWYKKMGIAR